MKAMGSSQSRGSGGSPRTPSEGQKVVSIGVVPRHADSADPLAPVPLEVLEEILLKLPAHQVVCVCRLVCREWKEVADSDSLWRERCRREGYRLSVEDRLPHDWRRFYFLCRLRRNLLKNSRAEEKLNGWKILENGGDQWVVENVRVQHPNSKVTKNFVTSYGVCRKSQLIDLNQEGYCAEFMDGFQPHIKISDWYAPRWDCGCEYEIRVHLLNEKKEPVKTFAPEIMYFGQWNDQKWNQMTHVFKDYGPGVRYINFIHGGKDTQFWAGWYGIRVTDSSVELCPSVDR